MMKPPSLLEGKYFSPTRPRMHNPMIAYVMITFIPEEKTELVPGRIRATHDKDVHIILLEDKLDLIKLHLACLKKYKAGVDFQPIVVDNSSTHEEGLKYLKEYCEKENIIFLSRPNRGFSFGGAKYAWDTFKDKYMFYMFTEQDVMPCKDGWLAEILLKFMQAGDTGMCGNIFEGPRSRDYFDKWRCFDPKYLGDYWVKSGENFLNCNNDGMVGFTSSKVLMEVDKIGGLNVQDIYVMQGDPKDIGNWSITPGVNELFYQHPILDLGYKLTAFSGDGEHVFTHGVSYVDFGDIEEVPEKAKPPMIHGQVMYCNKVARPWFDWYENKEDFKMYDDATA